MERVSKGNRDRESGSVCSPAVRMLASTDLEIVGLDPWLFILLLISFPTLQCIYYESLKDKYLY